ncbi:NACHT, LRR and PYD domains-containing protein 3-like isoform X2 [Ambystoma mexicanum]|uniref:NACHT, LRR and PYD domains-containing protein 3-like isoform X2 n=1 Tax=Ambystoma mexicanum TaxID=8296 RepID=UPI0037E9C43A
MAGRSKQILFSHLKDLEAPELHRFRSLLNERLGKDGCPAVPKRRAKKAEYMDIACCMIQNYEDAQALAVAVEILCQAGRQHLSEQLLQESQTYLEQRRIEKQEKEGHRRKYMQDLIEKCTLQEADNNAFGKCFNLNERYTKVLGIKNYCHLESRAHEFLSSGKKLQEIRAGKPGCSYSYVPKLFDRDKDGHAPRIVVLQGAAGIGKTTLARKIVLDWASGNLFQDQFEYVFYINCRDMYELPGQSAIPDLLFQSYSEMTKSKQGLVVDPGRLLFVIDGFDELRNPVLVSEAESTPQSRLLRNALICKSSIIITTRPTALGKLRKCVKVQRLEEILGFSEEDREEYFNAFFGNEKLGTQALQVVREYTVLFSMCFVPIVCWMVCSVFKKWMEVGEDLTGASGTLTWAYVDFLSHFLKQQSSETSQLTQVTMKRLCALAKDGVDVKKTQFEEEDLMKHGLAFSEIRSLFQEKDLFFKTADHHNIYRFAHLSFQEFFAALFYVLRDSYETTEHTANPQLELIGLLEDFKQQNQNHLSLVVRFVFGLSNTEIAQQMERRFKWKISSGIKTTLFHWCKEGLKEISGGACPLLVDFLHCLYEIRDEEFVKGALEFFQSASISDYQPQIDQRDFLKVLLFSFKNSPAIEKLSFFNYKMELEEVKALMPWTVKCSSLTFWECSITVPCCGELSAMLSTNQTLTELVLSYNDVTELGMRELCEGLKQPGCKIQKLEMCNCSLTGSSCADLASVLSTNPSLTELILADNPLEDSGVAQLCQGLQHPRCQLQKLELDECSLKGSCCADLAAALTRNPSLTDLGLRDNKLGDTGMSQLCEGLKHPDCRIQTLDLCCCSLTHSCCADLASVLRASSGLSELNLTGNDLGDAGVTQLCYGLKHPGCKIQILRLTTCSLAGPCCTDLSSVLAMSPALTELCLGNNELGDPGVIQLCQGLRHPDCKIQRLELESASLTDDSTLDLCSALSVNQTLQTLSLNCNEFTDKSITNFTQLKKTCRHLSELWLVCNKFSDQGQEEVRLLMNGED